ncbi:MAG: alpha/beta hydrolase [Pseudomonadota bacterium]
MSMLRISILGVLSAALAACGSSEPPLPPEIDCLGGGYRLIDGTVVGVIPRSADDLRYQLITGETGVLLPTEDGAWQSAEDGVTVTLGSCGEGPFVFDDGSSVREGEKIPYVVTETVFDGVDGKRAGRLVLPEGGSADAIIVALHGSEAWSGRTGDRFQTIMPAFGVGIFAYDKRGTGASDGAYTQDFFLLAEDATLARDEALRLYGSETLIGYHGPSQGGWVGPLAAAKGDVDFVIASYGMAESALAEDREEVFLDLREAGHSEDVIEKAREITDATGRVMASNFKSGYKELDAVREKYADEPWYEDIEGEFTRQFLDAPNLGLRIIGPFRSAGTPWDYDPRSTIEGLDVPQLWVIAEDDRSAPSGPTIAILKEIQETKDDLDLVIFPDTDHGIIEFIEAADGTRSYTKVADGYYALVRDYALTQRTELSVDGPEVFLSAPLEVFEEVDAEESGLPSGDRPQP